MSIINHEERGQGLFQNFVNFASNIGKLQIRSCMSILDFGCGAGGFLYTALKAGLDAYGVDCDPSRREIYQSFMHNNPKNLDRWMLYDGNILPFKSQTFDIVYSWYVLEHVQNIDQALREIVRVLKPGGFVALFTQDVRGAYDGHVRIPWPPFLHPLLYEAYLDEWGWDEVLAQEANEGLSQKKDMLEYMQTKVFYITAPQLLSTLEYFNMDVVHATRPDVWPSSISLSIQTPKDARNAAQYFKSMRDIGKWKVPTSQIAIAAKKKI